MSTKSFVGIVLTVAGFLANAGQENAISYTFTDLGTLGGSTSVATGINNAGQVVGYSYTTGDAAYRATLWNGSTATDLGTLGGAFSVAHTINDVGQVVGVSNITGNTAHHATLWNGSIATDLNSFLDATTVSAGWKLTDASAINDFGWVVGTAFNSVTYTSHAYLLTVTAVPEPEPYAMLFAGLGLIGATVKRRKST